MGVPSLPLAFEQSRVSMQVDEAGVPWFRADEVCAALELANPRDAVAKHVDEDDVAKRDTIDSLGRTQRTNFVNESGVYALIFGSRKPVAKRFKRWVTSEVLPAIRQTGRYDGVTKRDTIPDPRASERQELRDYRPSEREAALRDLRVTGLALVEEHEAAGATRTSALELAGKEIGRSPSTMWSWFARVQMVPEADRPFALTPRFVGGGRFAEIHPEAWTALCAMAVRPGARVGTCIRRVKLMAPKRGWEPIPCERTLRRRLTALRALPHQPTPRLAAPETIQ